MFKRLLLMILCMIVLAFGYNLSQQEIDAIDRTKLNEQEKYFVTLTEYLCSVDFKMSEPIAEQEKFNLFLAMSSRKEHAVETEDFYNEENETYQIPLDYINKIVAEHLTCKEINTTKLSKQSELFKGNFNPETHTYETMMIGGFGGVQPTVILDVTKENNSITITLGILDATEYAKNNIVLKSKYVAQFEVEYFDAKQYKIIKVTSE